jgi:hypothetical protein
MTIQEIKQQIRRGNGNYISGFVSWQSNIKTRRETFGDSHVIETQKLEVEQEWHRLYELGKKSIRMQKEELKIQEEFDE